MIPLICGDPEGKEPAAYTKFVLPFAYAPTVYREKITTPTYKPSDQADSARRHYVTVETAAVLFDRAKSFELDRKTYSHDFVITRDKRPITVRMSAPRVLLFEWPNAPERETTLNPRRDPLKLGFLMVETFFPEQDPPVSLDDLLALNEYFRYWQQPYEKHAKYYQAFLAQYPIGLPQSKITVGEADKETMYFGRWASFLKFPLEDENGTKWKLFPVEWDRRAIDWRHEVKAGWDSGWIAYADFRTFVWTCAILQDGGKTLSARFPHTSVQLPLHHYGHWIKLLNVDPPGDTPVRSHHSTAFEKDWVTPRTYRRWESYGTLYGFNYHSGAVLAPNMDNPPVWQHFRDEYWVSP